jgi:hypothetical protein
VITEWNETLWNVFLRRAVVDKDGRIEFDFMTEKLSLKKLKYNH